MARIRRANVDDARTVRDLLAELAYPVAVECLRDRLDRLAATGNDPVLLPMDGDTVVGLVALHFACMLYLEDPVARITALAVRNEARGMGVGRSLVDAGESLARRVGCGTLELTSAVDRTEAHAFYRRLGFANTSLRFARSVAPGPRGSDGRRAGQSPFLTLPSKPHP